MKKMRWFGKFCCAFATMALASLSMVGCDLEVDDKDNRAALVSSGDNGDNNDNNNNSTSVLYVGLGGENTFNISSVKVGDTAQAIKHATLTPSAWNVISEFETVQVPNGSSVSYTFTQAEAGADNWKTWSIAVYDNATVSSANGNLLRGDNWLNKSTTAGFAAGLWSDGDVTAGGTYSNDFTYETAGKSLTSSNTVVVKVEYSGSTVTITETVDGKLAYTTTGTISSSPDDNTTTDNTNTENKNDENGNSDSGSTENAGTDVTTETLSEAKTLAATSATSGYTVKLGCDGASMEVSSVKYNGTQLMPDNTKYALKNLSFSGVNVSGLTDDTWTVEYTYTMTAVGTTGWNDYNFEISDGNTDGGLGYWSLRYDNFAVGWLSGYHEYGTWTAEHCDGVSETNSAYGGHRYGMANSLAFDHSETLNKTLVMTVQKTASAFVITITSDGTQIWTCTNEATSN